MIQSEFGGDGTSLHLHLIGSLNARTAAALCEEYRARRVPIIRECVLDLTGVDGVDVAGLGVIRELQRAMGPRHVHLVLVCAGGPVAPVLRAEAKRLGVRMRAPVESI